MRWTSSVLFLIGGGSAGVLLAVRSLEAGRGRKVGRVVEVVFCVHAMSSCLSDGQRVYLGLSCVRDVETVCDMLACVRCMEGIAHACGIFGGKMV